MKRKQYSVEQIVAALKQAQLRMPAAATGSTRSGLKRVPTDCALTVAGLAFGERRGYSGTLDAALPRNVHRRPP